MCGIAGLIGEREPERLDRMLRTLAHRGPDDEGQEWIDAQRTWVGLGNRRLAILDLSPAGHQPMKFGSSVLAYNGEIYNFRELRRALESDGETFYTGTDTEVVLRLLVREGLKGLARLNGMFGLAYWDGDRNELLIARDRFGIKPLYYAWDNHNLAFASEYKSLLAAGLEPSLDLSALSGYLSFGWVPGETTMLSNVRELAPGHALRWRDGNLVQESFRHAIEDNVQVPDEKAAADEVRRRLRDSVRRQMIADVPVGVLLSGGLDSSAIAAFAAEQSSQPVRAYTISFRPEDAKTEQSAEDLRFSRIVAGEFGLDLKEFEIGPEIADLLPEVVWHLDDPIADPAAILSLIICRAAAPDVKVLLSGQGSDEIFGGYRVHVFDRVSRALGRVPDPLLRGGVAAIHGVARGAERLPGNLQGFFLAAHRTSKSVVDSMHLDPEERYISYRSAPYFSAAGLRAILAKDAAAEILKSDPHAAHWKAFQDAPGEDFFDRMLYVDLRTFLLNQNLVYGDRLSMAASVELRVPFLDDVVADYALAMPARYKVSPMLKGKQVLRTALKDVVPRGVIRRRKAGFGAPIRKWLRDDLKTLLMDTLSDDWVRRTDLFDRAEVRRLIGAHAEGTEDHTYRLWTLLAFAMWHQRHLD